MCITQQLSHLLYYVFLDCISKIVSVKLIDC